MIIVSKEEGRQCLLRCAQRHVGDDIKLKLVDIDEEEQYAGKVYRYYKDHGVASVDTNAVLFRSFYNKVPMVTFARAFSEWICPPDDDDYVPF
jgi:hypothetical protein